MKIRVGHNPRLSAFVSSGRDVVERTEVTQGRDQIRAIITNRAFQPVFQPIVDLERDAIVG
jgi:sensor c-di-GMP phosphodiesterase-like protein